MRNILFALTFLFLAGCAGLVQDDAKNLTRVQYVSKGMNREDVNTVMGREVVIGYEITDVKAGTTKPITMPNPHRSETVRDGERLLQVEFYFTHIRQPDGIISDDELTPLIFEDNRLIAKGWDALNRIRRN